jgi:sulfoxide reductase heme-binding subunit YedZ
VNRLLTSRWTKLTVFVLCFVPAVLLYWRWQHHLLGINWIEAAQRYSGDWTLRFLLLTLAITPARNLTGLTNLIRFRRMLGLYAFFYGCLHFYIYLWIDKGMDWLSIREDFTIRRFYIMGLLSLTLMVPLAITSTAGWIRRLGGRRWRMLHWLIYPSAAAGVVHYYWQGKSFVLEPVLYGAVLAVLLGYRAVKSLTRHRGKQNAGRPGPHAVLSADR